MGPLLIVADYPPVRYLPDLGEAIEQVQIQNLLPIGAVEPFDKCIVQPLGCSPFGLVVKYIRQGEAASRYVVSETRDEIVLQLTARFPDSAIFDELLTIKS